MLKEAYSLFARYYDRYMAEVEYDDWIRFILGNFSHLKKKNPAKILELACGTGNVSSKLVKRGLQVEGTDLSSEMLEVAKEKKYQADYQQRDMLDDIVGNDYDLILLLFDSINYLRHKSEITKLLENVYNALQPGGLFIFDISTSRNCKDNFDGFVNIQDEENGFVVHESEYDQLNSEQVNHFTFFLPEDKLYKRYDEIHRQKIYLVSEIVDLIKESKLKLLKLHRLVRDRDIVVPEDEFHFADTIYNRIFFVVEKADA